jgi:acetyl-CoA carboxylase biotin carboxyl carrier protein
MTIQDIKELLELFHSSGVAEMEVQRGDGRVRFSRGSTVNQVVAAPAPVAAAASAPIAASSPSPAATPTTAPAAADENTIVKSPIVGTFYESPSPDAPAFVKVGDQVEKGQVLCIIESMKLMNEIEAEVAGTIVARLVENARPVEYGEPLFTVKPR